MESPMISVLMPAYNAMPLIKASVKSLLLQTYSDWECVIVDDGSTDGTSEYLDSLQDSRFVVHHFPLNQGRPAARQKTLELARGKYICMLDAGDLYARNTLQVLLTKMGTYSDAVLVSANMCSFGTHTPILRKRGATSEQVFIYNGSIRPNHASSILIADRAKKYKYNPALKLGQDQDFLARYLANAKLVLIPHVLYYYSEFDSVTKKKIRKAHLINAKQYFRSGNYILCLKRALKYVYASLIYPFFSIEKIISSRGLPLDEENKISFQDEIKPIIEMALQNPEDNE